MCICPLTTHFSVPHLGELRNAAESCEEITTCTPFNQKNERNWNADDRQSENQYSDIVQISDKHACQKVSTNRFERGPQPPNET